MSEQGDQSPVPLSAQDAWSLDARLPSQVISPAPGQVRALPAPSAPLDVLAVPVRRSDGTEASLATVLDDTYADAYVVLHDGNLVVEGYAPPGAADRRHMLMSISKSVVGAVAAVLVEQGLVEVDRRVVDYLPELAAGGYADATVRHVLDMRTGVAFREDYTDPEAEFRALDEAIGWRDGAAIGLHAYLATLASEGPSGGRFSYRSVDSDVLGWICERAAGALMAGLISELVWSPMGAQAQARLVTDSWGDAIHDGGMTAVARDVARFGQLLLDAGEVPTPGGGSRQVLPSRWLRQAYAVDADVRDAFLASPSEMWFPGGWYRNQMWFRPGEHGDVLLCLGIHGQMLHVSRRTRTVCVALSSWPQPQRPELLYDQCAAFDQVGGVLAGLEPVTSRHGLPGVAAGLHRHPH